MLPFMAHGHLIPFLALARQIHQTTNFTITIAATPINTAYLRSAVAADPVHSHRLRLASLPFNSSDHHLPPNTESTEAVPLSQIISLFHASAALEAPARHLAASISAAEGRPPICIISDVFHGWATRVADSIGTVNVSFTTCGGYGTAAYISVWQNLPHRKAESDEFSVPGFPNGCKFHSSQLHPFIRAADGKDPWSRFFQPQISLSLGSFGWLCNTAEEIEPLGLQILRKYIQIPVWTIGPLLPKAMLFGSKSSDSNLLGGHNGRQSGISPQKCLDWLNSKPNNSVVYISFGSQNTIGATQMMELAKGLEQSRKPFIWVIRPPIGFDPKDEFRSEWLPEGFEERKQGLLVRGWAPQVAILGHKSTGGFLSHCGWNSAMEGLSQGVAVIGWPLAAEQAYNSKLMMEEMGVCVEVARGVQSEVTAEEVKRVVELVMDESGKGGEMRRKAGEIGELIRAAMQEEEEEGKGSSLRAMDDFVSAILSAAQPPQRKGKIPSKLGTRFTVINNGN
ncbi:UDP-glucosyltransferase 73B2 [Actinidia rufa]|uniref:UDP-glucosyltransferase 73B2 n=1 Tax=Actinidia rufa TaxID=165716 RepID=A0A7J0GXZ9_9ERIC|nr:UDP-glucosyltransferase 73B2 [Actinidia rufa]